MYKIYKIVLAAALIAATTLTAKPIKIGTGGPTGNYFAMMNDIASPDYCGTEIPMIIMNTSGSVENADNLVTKRASAGIVQIDVLKYKAKRDPGRFNDKRIKIIHQLHTESIHVLIPVGYSPKMKTSMWGTLLKKFSKDEPMKLDINALKNQQVASTGGSVVSAQALSMFLGLNLKVVDVDGKGFPKGLPIILTGGQPDSRVESLLSSGKYVLASLDIRDIPKSASFYVPVDLNYKIGSKMQAVPSIGVQAVLIGKASRKASRNVRMSKLAACISNSLEDLADDSDTNPNWESVYELSKERIMLNWDEFPILEK